MRTSRARIAGPNEDARELIVRIEQERDGRFRGRLVIEIDGARQERVVTDPGCDELIEAIGFFIALSIDPNASVTVAPPAVPRERGDAAKPAAPPKPTAVPPPTASTLPPPASPSTPPPPPSIAATPEPTSATSERSWYVAGGVGMGLVSGTAPQPAVASRALIELSWLPKDGSAFAPAAALIATSTTTSTVRSAFGGLALRWQALTGSFCPLVLQLVSSVSLRPCAGVEVGALRGEGVAIRNAKRIDAPWVALGLSGQADVAVWQNLVLMVEGGMSSPFLRSRFAYSSGAAAFETPALGGRVGLTLALRL